MSVFKFATGVACTVVVAHGSVARAQDAFATKFPVYHELGLDPLVRARLAELYRTNRQLAGTLDEFYAINQSDYERARGECTGDLGTDVRLRTARRILIIISYHERFGPLPEWLVKHLSKLQQIACCLPDAATQGRVDRVLEDWVTELERGPAPVNLQRHFANAARLRPLFEFAMELQRASKPVWTFRDFYPPR